jgi:hypothetical protein
VPAGWGWSELRQRGPNFVTLDFDATRPQQGAPDNVNKLWLSVPMPRETSLPKYIRVDSEGTEKLANGATLSWRMGLKFSPHYGFDAIALIGSRHLNFSVLDAVTPKFDKGRLRDAVASVAGSMREAPTSNAIFHPVWRFSAEEASKNWRVNSVTPAGLIGLRCMICENEQTYLNIYPVELPKAPPSLDGAFANIVDAVGKNGIKPGEMRQDAAPGGQIRWTEQPGARWLFSGVVQREGRLLFMSLVGQAPPSVTMDMLRADYLAIAKTVRPWDGR